MKAKNKGYYAKAAKLTALVDYHRSSIVSNEIISGKSGNVTLFAFDKNQGLSEHTAPYDALVQVLDGKLAITISGEKQVLTRNEMIIMPAHRPHALKALTKLKMMLVMIRA